MCVLVSRRYGPPNVFIGGGGTITFPSIDPLSVPDQMDLTSPASHTHTPTPPPSSRQSHQTAVPTTNEPFTTLIIAQKQN